MTIWDAARLASRRPLPKPRKMLGPVGPAALLRAPDGSNWVDAIREVGDSPDYPSRVNLGRSCGDCGYHVCSCEPYAFYRQARAQYPDAKVQVHSYLSKGRAWFANGTLTLCPQDIPSDVLKTMGVAGA